MFALRCRWRTGHITMLALSVLIASLSACSSPSYHITTRNLSPLISLHDAIHAVLTAPTFSLVVSTSPALPGQQKSVGVERVVIEEPDRVSISGGPNVIAIGSTGYFKVQPGWTVVHHVGESTNFTNDMLLYLHVLDRTTSVIRHGETYVVPSQEATRLLVTTRITAFQKATDIGWSADLQGGLLKSMLLRYTWAFSPFTNCNLCVPHTATQTTVRTTITGVGALPKITAPPKSQIVPGDP